MLTRSLKLKINKSQEKYLNHYLFHLEGIYNWAHRQIKLNLDNKINLSYYDLDRLTKPDKIKYPDSKTVSIMLNIHSQVIQHTLKRARLAWDRYFYKKAGRPKLKSRYRRLSSFVFPQILEAHYPKENKIQLPGIKKLRFFKQDIPDGKIKTIRIQKKSSGWYAILTIDTNYKITKIKETKERVGIDTGFSSLLTLSNGIKYENPREFRKTEYLLAQSQRSGNKKRSSKLQEHISNQRKDRNHKISTDLIRNYKEIYITNDNLKGQSKKFGKSVSEASIGQLRQFLLYKGLNSGRKVVLVDSHKSTMTCSNCWSLTGPTGLSGLAVRQWECSACGAVHDRDINSAMFTLKVGVGTALMVNS